MNMDEWGRGEFYGLSFGINDGFMDSDEELWRYKVDKY